ncbi:MAG: carbon storage regulator [Patescibacteria group bacterium]
MLVLARKVGQSIVIGEGDNEAEILVIEIRGDQIRLGINARRNIPVHRKELLEQIKAEKNAQSATTNE